MVKLLFPDVVFVRNIIIIKVRKGRILTDCEDGFLKGKRFLIHDRDPLYNHSNTVFRICPIQEQCGVIGRKKARLASDQPGFGGG